MPVASSRGFLVPWTDPGTCPGSLLLELFRAIPVMTNHRLIALQAQGRVGGPPVLRTIFAAHTELAAGGCAKHARCASPRTAKKFCRIPHISAITLRHRSGHSWAFLGIVSILKRVLIV
jgi:hypothetical protein